MKTTDELRNAIRSSSDPAMLAGGAFTPPDFTFYLCSLLERRDWLVKDAIRACYLERSYGYQLFNGTRPPTRTFTLPLSSVIRLRISEGLPIFSPCTKRLSAPAWISPRRNR